MNSSILIVDDEEAIRKSLHHTLARCGYRVETVPSGEEAIRKFYESPADLVLTDIVLEGTNGLGVLKEVVRTKPDTMVIVMTDYSDQYSAAEALQLGAFDCLQKPCNLDELRLKIASALEKQEHIRRLSCLNDLLLDTRELLKEERESKLPPEKSLRRFFNSLDTFPVPLRLQTQDYSSPFSNSSFKKEFGDPGKQTCHEFFGKTEPCADCHVMDALLKNETRKINWVAPNGKSYMILSSPITVARGKRLAVSMYLDISLEASLEGKGRKLAEMVNQFPSSVMITDIKGKIEFVNDTFCNSSGFSREEVLGKTPRIVKSDLHPVSFYENFWDTLLSGKEWRGYFRNKKKNGTLVWEYQHIRPLMNAEGNPTHFVSVKYDDTARIMEEENKKKILRELEEANETMKEFVLLASHDLQEPLRKVITFGDLALRNLGRDDGKVARYIEKQQQATQRMKLLLESMLDLSKLTAKNMNIQEVNLGGVVGEVMELLEEQIAKKGGEIESSPTLPVIKADREQMVHLFQNMISNSLKYQKQNVPPRISIEVHQNKKGTHLLFRDNGIGFDKKYFNKIFKPFERLHGKGAYEGTGMGLAICKKIVERHKGSIRVSSVPEKGTVFIITLPADPAEFSSREI